MKNLVNLLKVKLQFFFYITSDYLLILLLDAIDANGNAPTRAKSPYKDVTYFIFKNYLNIIIFYYPCSHY